MDINKSINHEQALPEGQQPAHDFQKILDVFAQVKKSLEDKLGTRRNQEQNFRYELTEAEKDKVIEDVIANISPSDAKALMSKNGHGAELDKQMAVKFIKENSQRGYFRFPEGMVDGRERDKDNTKPKTIEEKAKEAATDDKAFEKIKNASDDFEKSEPQLYYATIINVLRNNEQGGSLPDPSKYLWACEQLVRASTLKFQIIETSERQSVEFKVQLPGMQQEETIKLVDFKQQKDIAPIDAYDFKDLHTTETAANSTLTRQVDTRGISYTENPPTTGIDGKPVIQPPTQIKERPVDKYNRINNDPSSLFYEVKQKLGYNMKEPANQEWNSLENAREVVTSVLFMLRNTPSQVIEKTVGVTNEQGLERAK